MGDRYQIKDQHAIHFVTCQVVGWADVFSRKVYRDTIIKSLDFCRKNKGLIIYGYVIMTNHLHLIVQCNNGYLSDVIRDFKRFTSRSIMNEIASNQSESRREWLEIIFQYHAKFNRRVERQQFWTHENHAVELTSNEMMDSKLHYIHQNPVRAGWVEEPEHYLYSSARNYAGLNALLEIAFIE